ncbi:glutaredoxin family protein [Ornithinimicrobium faecis]
MHNETLLSTMIRWLRRPAGAPTTPRITLVDRVGCHLCVEAERTVRKVAEDTENRWERVDVDSSPELLERFDDLVPVILVDGREVAHWTITEDTLVRALRRRRRP